MTTVAWDGRTLAVDRRIVAGEHYRSGTKFRVATVAGANVVMAYTGFVECGQLMMDWFESGAKKEDFPACQQDKDDWARLIVAQAVQHSYGWTPVVYYYDSYPSRQDIEDSHAAWGSGSECALAAMYCGKDATEAVEIAARFVATTGNGWDAATMNKDGEWLISHKFHE